jgi:TolB-like protein
MRRTTWPAPSTPCTLVAPPNRGSPNQPPYTWHSRAGGAAVHSIINRRCGSQHSAAHTPARLPLRPNGRSNLTQIMSQLPSADVIGYQLMTTEDPKIEIEVPRSGTPASEANAPRWTSRRISGIVAALAAVGTVLAGLTGYWTTYRTVTRELLAPVKPGPTTPTEAARFSIVVLPFANLSGDPSQDYFADAVTENLTTGLSRAKLFVIARNTAFTYKGKNIDAKEIGKELGVRYVLEGSVQRDQNRVRVNAQLIDAHSGAHLWADQFDTTRADLLQMQDEIVARINSAALYELLKAEAQKGAIATNPDALDLATRCASVVSKAGLFGKEAEAGHSFCEQALNADPNNVIALSMSSIWFTVAILLGRRSSGRPEAGRRTGVARDRRRRELSVGPCC